MSKLNRRRFVAAGAALGATAATLVPGAVVAGALSREDTKRDLLIRLGDLKLSGKEALAMMVLGMALEDGHWCRDDTRALLDQGLPVSEVHKRISQQLEANCDAFMKS